MAAQAALPFMQALLTTPKGVAALGKTIGAIGHIAGLTIGGKRGAKLSQQAQIFAGITGLGTDIMKAVGPSSSMGTPTDKKDITTNFTEALQISEGMPSLTEGLYTGSPGKGVFGGVLDKSPMGWNTNTPLEGISKDLFINNNNIPSLR